MTTIIIVCVASLLQCAPFLFAQAPDASPPPELAAARAQYQKSIEADKERYVQQLEQLKPTALFTNNSSLADAISKEIASLGSPVAATADIPGTDSAAADLITQKLSNTTWQWWRGQTITFLPDGQARWNVSNSEAFTWKVVETTPPAVMGKKLTGTKYKIIFDPALQSGKITEGNLPARGTLQIMAK